MITAVDTSVLLDVFTADARFGESSRAALRRCSREGRLVACVVVWAEVAGVFPEPAAAHAALQILRVGFDGTDERGGLRAGAAFSRYRARGGTRERVIADFLVGAHAATRADRLLTRDRGFYRDYFDEVDVLDPAG